MIRTRTLVLNSNLILITKILLHITCCFLTTKLVVADVVPPLPPINGAIAQYLDGKFAVNEAGASTYSIPLKLIPGTADFTPKLALHYDSTGTNSYLGINFKLGGMSVITRCGTTIAQDGFIDPVDYNANDKFCLEGVRLVKVQPSSVYGGDGTEYRTENERFSKIISYGNIGNFPSYFLVWTRTGLVYEYGNSVDSKFQPQSTSGVLAWHVNKITDSSGNYINYKYNNNGSFGELLPDKIEYTGNTAVGSSPYASVQFISETRPDTLIGYIGGAKISFTQRIKEIALYYQSTKVAYYPITYEQAPESGISRVISVGYCEISSNSCVNPTLFQYSGAYLGLDTPTIWLEKGIVNGPPWSSSAQGFADLNADGREDFYWNRNGFQVGISDGNDFTQATYLSGSGWKDPYKGFEYITDVNGDAKVDRVSVEYTGGYNAKINASIGTGNGLNPYTTWLDPSVYKNPILYAIDDLSSDGFVYFKENEYMIDLNADGMADRVWLSGWGFNTDWFTEPWGTWVSFSNSSSFMMPDIWLGYPCGKVKTCPPNNYDGSSILFLSGGPGAVNAEYLAYWGDINGDHLPDQIQASTYYDGFNLNFTEWTAYINRGDHFDSGITLLDQNSSTVPAYSSFQKDEVQEAWLDLNGDGLTDHVYIPNQRRDLWVSLSTGNSFTIPALWLAEDTANGFDPRSLSNDHFFFADVNADGYPDFVWVPDGSQDLYVAFSNGHSFTTPKVLLQNGVAGGKKSYSNGGTKTYFVELNGDGVVDYAWMPDGTEDLLVAKSKGPRANQLQHIIVGNGLEYKITMTTLAANDGSYLKGTGAVYPAQDLQPVMPVVKSYQVSDGLGGFNDFTYKYTGYRQTVDGRGSCGFESIIESDQARGITTTTYYRQDHPFKSKPASIIKSVSATGAVVSNVSYDWGVTYQSTGGYFIYESKIITTQYELDGSVVITKSESRTFDQNGNPTKIVTQYNDGLTETIDNTYQDDTTKWQLGLLIKKVSTKQLLSQPIIKNESQWSYYAQSGLPSTEVIEPGNALEIRKEFYYDQFGNISELKTSGPSFTTRSEFTTYDSSGRGIISEIDALGHTTQRTLDSKWGQVQSETDPNGLKTEYLYDIVGVRNYEKRADGTESRVLSLAADAASPPLATYYHRNDRSGMIPKIVWYDLLDRKVREQSTYFDGQIANVDYIYDKAGRLTQKSLPYWTGAAPIWATYEYDVLGRLVKEKAPGNRITEYIYDGLTTSVIDPKGNVTIKEVNPREKVSRITDATGSVTSYTYDSSDRLILITDPKNNITQLDYDIFGHRAHLVDPDVGTIKYDYNALGQLLHETANDGLVTDFIYDAAGRMISRKSAEGNASWVYDQSPNGIGAISEAYGQDGEVERYSYDQYSRRFRRELNFEGESYVEEKSFDSLGREIKITYPSGFEVAFNYNTNGFLSSVSNVSNGKIFWEQKKANVFGQIQQERFGNGIRTVNNSNANTGLLESIKSSLSLSGDIQDLGFDHDKDGNITKREDRRSSLIELFDYDQLNRLIKSQVIGGDTVTLAYDELGNILNKSDVGSYFYGTNGAGPHAVTTISGIKANKYRYDQRGNRIESDLEDLTYTSFNKPSEIVSSNVKLDFKYNSNLGLLKQTKRYQSFNTNLNYNDLVSIAPALRHKSSTISTEEIIYISSLYEIRKTDNFIEHRHYIPGSGRVIALFSKFSNRAPVYRYIHRDHIGSIDRITDENGKVIERLSYDSWGKRRNADWSPSDQMLSSPMRKGFTGHEHLDDVGLIHMGGRIYDPSVGRFLSPDPLIQEPENSQSLNRYSYVMNNPLSLTDPSGFGWFSKLWKGITNVVKGIFSQQGLEQILLASVTSGWSSGFQLLAFAGYNVGKAIASGEEPGNALKFGAKLLIQAAVMKFFDAQILDPISSSLDKALPGILSPNAFAGGMSNYEYSELLRNNVVSDVTRSILRGARNVVVGGRFMDGVAQGAFSSGLGLARDSLIFHTAKPFVLEGLGNSELSMKSTWVKGQNLWTKDGNPNLHIKNNVSILYPWLNNIGKVLTQVPQAGHLYTPGFGQELGALSNFANQISGMNSLSVFHDHLADLLNFSGHPQISNILNVGTIPPAIGLEYSILLSSESVFPTVAK